MESIRQRTKSALLHYRYTSLGTIQHYGQYCRTSKSNERNPTSIWRAENVGNAVTGHHAENATSYDDRQRQYAVHPPLP